MKNLIKPIIEILFLCLSTALFAQTSQIPSINNTCENASWFNFDASESCNEISIDHTNNTLNKNPSCDYFTSPTVADSYINFIVPPSGHIRFSYFYNYGISIFKNCNGTELFCYTRNRYSLNEEYHKNYIDVLNLTPGDTLIAQIFQPESEEIGYYGYYESTNFTVCAQEIGTALNDNCENPVWIDLLPGGTPTSFNVNHTLNTLYLSAGCAAFNFADSYFNLVVPPSGELRFRISASSERSTYGIGVFNSCEGEQLAYGCSSSSAATSAIDVANLIPGDTVLIQVFQSPPKYLDFYNYNIEPTEFEMEVSEVLRASNNTCNGAKMIDIANIAFQPNNYSLNIEPACASNFVKADVFYKFEVPTTGAVKFTRTIFEPYNINWYYYNDEAYSFGGISIYENCTSEALYCISDERFDYQANLSNPNGDVYGAVVIADLTPGDTLIVQLFAPNYDVSYATFFEVAQPTTNNKCEQAIAIDLNTPNLCTDELTFSLNENSLNVLPPCFNNNDYGDINPYADIFYQTKVPESGKIDCCLSSPVGIAVYDACEGNVLFCNNKASEILLIDNLPPNDDVIIQFFDYWDMPDEFSFCLKKPTLNCDRNDWTALKALYESTNGNNWLNNTGWEVLSANTAPPDCNLSSLYGVELNEAGRVGCIDLDGVVNCTYNVNSNGNNLTGTLPEEIGLLNELTELCLNYNTLSGNLPVGLSKLTNLRGLWLHNNQLSGELPNFWDKLDSLEFLFLSDNKFSGTIPDRLSYCDNLKELGLFQNKLVGNMPVNFKFFRNIEIINLRNNQLSGRILSQVGDIKTLKKLYLSNNNYKGQLPPNLSNLSNLETFHIYNNEFSGCFYQELNSLCEQLTEASAGPHIDTGNSFDAKWADFCACVSGTCAPQSTYVIDEPFPSQSVYQHNGNIETSGVVLVGEQNVRTVIFSAENIYLNEGFEVKKGVTFTARYGPCE